MNKGIRFSGIESSVFVFVGKELKADQIFIINLEELLGVVLAVPLSDYSPETVLEGPIRPKVKAVGQYMTLYVYIRP